MVVAFGTHSEGSWHPGDRLRLVFLLEASLTTGGFSLLALLVLSVTDDENTTWQVLSALWALFMACSLWFSHARIGSNRDSHGDVDRVANALLWHSFAPFLAAITLNLAGPQCSLHLSSVRHFMSDRQDRGGA